MCVCVREKEREGKWDGEEERGGKSERRKKVRGWDYRQTRSRQCLASKLGSVVDRCACT